MKKKLKNFKLPKVAWYAMGASGVIFLVIWAKRSGMTLPSIGSGSTSQPVTMTAPNTASIDYANQVQNQELTILNQLQSLSSTGSGQPTGINPVSSSVNYIMGKQYVGTIGNGSGTPLNVTTGAPGGIPAPGATFSCFRLAE